MLLSARQRDKQKGMCDVMTGLSRIVPKRLRLVLHGTELGLFKIDQLSTF